MKKAIYYAIIALTIVTAAIFLVTCDGLFDLQDGSDEWTDVEYEVIGSPGNERVKSVTLYLDGKVVPKTQKQRAIERALTLEGARMSHDFFEAVFISGSVVARASWEIGQAAGISGVDRGAVGGTGINYISADPASPPCSTIFVGKKTGKTLLGVGYLTQVDGTAASTANTVGEKTDSVTFTISPLANWLGLRAAAAPATHFTANTLRKDVGNYVPPQAGPPVVAESGGKNAGFGTFETSFNATPVAGTQTLPATNYPSTGVSATNTWGEIINPRGTGASFPMYYLPSVKSRHANVSTGDFTVAAAYKIGGLTDDTIDEDSPSAGIHASFPSGTGLANAVRIWGDRSGTLSKWTEDQAGTTPPGAAVRTTTANLKGGFQVIKRTPAFMFEGRNYEIVDTVLDKVTQVSERVLPAADSGFPVADGLQMYFTMKQQSGGIFAITFQVPVYAMTAVISTNAGKLPPEKWWIRPDYQQYQYLLDNGTDSGGAVLLGTDVQGGADWININTQGIGFSNE